MKKEMWVSVISISLLPAVWALGAGIFGVQTAPVAMIAATIFIMGSEEKNAPMTMSIGMILGVIFSAFSVWLIPKMPFSVLVATCIVLIVVVAIIVIIQSYISRWANLFGWLCSYSVGMTLFKPDGMINMSIQLIVSMLVGIWFIGLLGGKVKNMIL